MSPARRALSDARDAGMFANSGLGGASRSPMPQQDSSRRYMLAKALFAQTHAQRPQFAKSWVLCADLQVIARNVPCFKSAVRRIAPEFSLAPHRGANTWPRVAPLPLQMRCSGTLVSTFAIMIHCSGLVGDCSGKKRRFTSTELQRSQLLGQHRPILGRCRPKYGSEAAHEQGPDGPKAVLSRSVCPRAEPKCFCASRDHEIRRQRRHRRRSLQWCRACLAKSARPARRPHQVGCPRKPSLPEPMKSNEAWLRWRISGCAWRPRSRRFGTSTQANRWIDARTDVHDWIASTNSTNQEPYKIRST